MAEMGCDQISGPVLTRVLSCVLTRLIDVNDKNSGAVNHPITKFHAQRAPSISVSAYLDRIRRFSNCSDECFVIALIYIDRLIELKNFVLSHLNVHRIVITSVLVATKFFDDQFYNNAYYARVGGVPCAEMNSLELEFLLCTNYSLFVTPELFEKYRRELANYAHSAVVPRKPQSCFGEGYVSQESEATQDHVTSMAFATPPPSDYLRNTQFPTHSEVGHIYEAPHVHVQVQNPVHVTAYPMAAPQLTWSYSYPSYAEAPYVSTAMVSCAPNMQTPSHFTHIPTHPQCPHDPMMAASTDGAILMMQPAPPPLFHHNSYPFGPPQRPYMPMHAAQYTQPTFYVPVGGL